MRTFRRHRRQWAFKARKKRLINYDKQKQMNAPRVLIKTGTHAGQSWPCMPFCQKLHHRMPQMNTGLTKKHGPLKIQTWISPPYEESARERERDGHRTPFNFCARCITQSEELFFANNHPLLCSMSGDYLTTSESVNVPACHMSGALTPHGQFGQTPRRTMEAVHQRRLLPYNQNANVCLWDNQSMHFCKIDGSMDHKLFWSSVINYNTINQQ